ncbi:right-handed parallel beta-helix repeat-containing protein [Prolixibacteraceae bacterium Z1-6]|uniref:Right-handed parallel beta-helix repeat-containing protein n=1 Tax=Draconibacterium aestuarii TaxID=2998507 RepID=A0A9X3F989_9BACT|nr:right-handed parallel beta-helix repeat-containing protein [Prolixibacteraceae bacterium Z1-6]
MKQFYAKLFLVLVFSLLLGLTASAVDIWVSPGGNDTNSGTEKKPLATIQKGLAKARELRKVNDPLIKNGIYIVLKEGDYLLKEPIVFTPEDSGTKESPTVIVARNNTKAIISGGVPVTGWELVEGKIYKARLNRESKLRSLFVNGERKRMAGTDIPVNGLGNWGSFKIEGDEPWAFGAGSAIDGIKFSSEDIQSMKNPEDVELVQFNIWTEKILCARAFDQIGDTTIVKLQQPYGAIATTMAWAGKINYNKKFVIRNAYELLDSPGEFYFDKNTNWLYYYSDGENMNTAKVIAPVSEGLIVIKGSSTNSKVKNIRFERITFSNDHWPLMEVAGSSGFAGIQSLGLAVKYIPGGNWHHTEYNSTDVPRGAIQVENAENIEFIRNWFEGISSAIAINLVNDVKNSKVEGNYFHDLLGNAVNLGHPQHYKIGDGAIYGENVEGLCENNTVANNYLRNSSLDFRQAEGITSFFVANTKIEHNDIARTPYGAITCGWWWGNADIPPSSVAKNNSISYNKAGNTHQVLDDGGIIYLLGEQPGTRVEDNYVFNGPRCIYPDDGSAYLTITRNVVDNNSYKWMWLHLWTKRCHDIEASENYVKNNLLMNNGTDIVIENTHAFREDEFPDNALKIIENAGIEDEFKAIIPEVEPAVISIHPKDFKERDVFH